MPTSDREKYLGQIQARLRKRFGSSGILEEEKSQKVDTNRLSQELIGLVSDNAMNGVNELITRSLSRTVVLDDEILLNPPNCRLLTISGMNPTTHFPSGAMVIELPPHYRQILHYSRRFRLPLPYTIFVLGFTIGPERQNLPADSKKFIHPGPYGVGFVQKPLKSVQDYIQRTSFSNTGGNTWVCQEIDGTYQNLTDYANDVVRVFFSTEFGDDYLQENVVSVKNKKKHFKYFSEWEKIQPLDILEYEFPIQGRVFDVLKEISYQNSTKNQDLIYKTINHVVRNVQVALNPESLKEIL